MKRSESKRFRCRELLALLTECADKGAPFPRNDDICERLLIIGAGNPYEYIRHLEQNGLIRVERKGYIRRATIVSTGRRTDWSPPLAKKRQRSGFVHHVNAEAFSDDALARLRVERDPCPRCGVRADVGCSHRGQTLQEAGRPRSWQPLDGAASAYARAAMGIAA